VARREDSAVRGAEARSRIIVRALRMVLRPLARFLIAEQIPLAAAVELLKSSLVEEAEGRFALPDKPLSHSRVSLLTGVHRKDVKRLRSAAESGARKPLPTSLSARLIADWNALPRFLDEAGRPLPLHRSSASGSPSIRDLTQTAGQEIRPQATVDEWLRQGVVVIDEENRIRLNQDAFVPEGDLEEKAHFFGRNLGEHIAACAENMSGQSRPQLDQAVYYSGLTQTSAERLEQRARELAVSALRTLNREAHELQEGDRARADAVHRIHFGAYFHRGEVEPGEGQ
jgi:Family of unknown function (DUF6502)